MTTNGAIAMAEDSDRKWLESLLTPIQKDIAEIKRDIKDLPCTDHAVKIGENTTRIANGRDHAKDTQTVRSESRDFVIKAITIVLAVLTLGGSIFGILYMTGFFKGLAK